MNWLRSIVLRHPMPARVLGKTLLLIGAILILSAVFGRVGLVADNTRRAEAKQPTVKTLAQAFPQYATAVVPEGPVGFTVAAVLVLAGIGLTVLAGDAGKRRGR
jgi:hypothetical protein